MRALFVRVRLRFLQQQREKKQLLDKYEKEREGEGGGGGGEREKNHRKSGRARDVEPSRVLEIYSLGEHFWERSERVGDDGEDRTRGGVSVESDRGGGGRRRRRRRRRRRKRREALESD